MGNGSAESVQGVLEERIDGLPGGLFDARVNSQDQVELLWVSDKVADLFGMAADSLLLEPAAVLTRIPPGDLPPLEAVLSQALSENRQFACEFRVLGDEGYRWVRVSAAPSKVEEPWVWWRGWIEDVTALKDDARIARASHAGAVEERLQSAQRLESLGLLAGGIAHDLGNLLVAMLGNAELARLELDEEHDVQERLIGVEKAARQAASLCNQMLAYVGQSSSARVPVDLSKMVEEMVELLSVALVEGVDFKIDTVDDAVVVGDSTQLRQVLMNLVTNAADAVGAGPGLVSIDIRRVRCTAEFLATTFLGEELPAGSYVLLEVADTGNGMNAETKRRVFDPFFTTKDTGRGLGLAAVLGIARAHRGAIQVHSREGHGTRMRLYFPASEVQAADDEEIEHGSYRGPPLRLSSKVLVIDDDDLVMRVVTSVLSRAGYEVLSAGDGKAGLELFRECQADIGVIILDMAMPVMDGYETLVALREFSSVPVIVASGYFDGQENDEELEVSVRLQKPYAPRQLLEAVRSTLLALRS